MQTQTLMRTGVMESIMDTMCPLKKVKISIDQDPWIDKKHKLAEKRILGDITNKSIKRYPH